MVAIPGFIGGVAGGAVVSVTIAAIDRFSGTFARAQMQAKKTGVAFNKMAIAAKFAGVAVGVGLALSLIKVTAMAISLETVMASVRKTTGMTGKALEDLKDGFIDLSKEIPDSVDNLAKIGAVAGQLGIRGKQNILKFSRVTAMMAVATEFTSEEAALALAQE